MHSCLDRQEVGVVNANLLPDVKPDRRTLLCMGYAY